MIEHDHLNNLISPKQWLLRLVFWGGALAVGFVAVIFALGAQYSIEWFHWLTSISPWLPFAIMPAGLALSVWITRRFFEGSQGSGIPQTIGALHAPNQHNISSLLSLRIAAGKVLLTIFALACGASVGREGPTVQIGASIMYSLRKYSGFSHLEQFRALIVAGAAAGVAAAFNTPLAGIVFAIEELSRSFEQRTNGLILTAVIFAGLAANAILGNYTYFGTISTSIEFGMGWVAVLVCGILCGISGGFFARLLIKASDGWGGNIGKWMRLYPVRFAALCGFVLACIGILSGNHTYGTGYDEVRDMIQNGDAGYHGYAIFKFLATLVSYLSGIPGGIFAPSLAIGAGMGATFSHFLLPVPIETMIVLGMVGYFAGVTQSPLTSFIIVMEMTDNHNLIIPLMATALIAHGFSKIVCREPLYLALATRFLKRIQGQQTTP